MNSLESQVLASLEKVSDPELHKPLTELGMVGDVSGNSEKFQVQIKLTVSHCPMKAELENSVKETLIADFPNSDISVELIVMTPEELAELKLKLRGREKINPFLDSPTRVILVGSGKG
ncbi:MAG: DUF59 domain-containing protein, partial [Microbacteriaceae bacterium]|nr:DUF59 domain-containing protein [Microbacteriaceae bacterium]